MCGVLTEGFSWFAPTKSARNWSAQIIRTLGRRADGAAGGAPAAEAVNAADAMVASRRNCRREELVGVGDLLMWRLLDVRGCDALGESRARLRVAGTIVKEKGAATGGPPFPCQASLEVELKAELHDARCVGRSDLSERSCGQVPIRVSEIDVVEQVEDLRTELQGGLAWEDE